MQFSCEQFARSINTNRL